MSVMPSGLTSSSSVPRSISCARHPTYSKVSSPRLLPDGAVEPVVSDDRSLFVHSLDRILPGMCGVRGSAFGDRC